MSTEILLLRDWVRRNVKIEDGGGTKRKQMRHTEWQMQTRGGADFNCSLNVIVHPKMSSFNLPHVVTNLFDFLYFVQHTKKKISSFFCSAEDIWKDEKYRKDCWPFYKHNKCFFVLTIVLYVFKTLEKNSLWVIFFLKLDCSGCTVCFWFTRKELTRRSFCSRVWQYGLCCMFLIKKYIILLCIY